MKKELGKFLSVLLLCEMLAFQNLAVAQTPRQTGGVKTCNVGLDPVDTHRPLANDEMFVVTTDPWLITYDTGSHARGVKGAQPVTCILPAGIQMAVKKDTCVVQWDRPSGNQVFEPKDWVIPCHPDVLPPATTQQPPRDKNINLAVTGIPQRIEVDVKVGGAVTHKVEGEVALKPTEPLSKTYRGQDPPPAKTPPEKSRCGRKCKIALAVLGIGGGGYGIARAVGGRHTTIIQTGYQPLPPPLFRPAP